jgi:hypothetical protein
MIWFKPSTAVRTNITTFGMAVRNAEFAVKVEVGDGFKGHYINV